MNRKRQGGFSLIEIMLVDAIIAILGAALLLGAGGLVTGSKTRSTKAMLTTLQGMFGELDSRMHGNLKAPAAWRWNLTGTTTPITVGAIQTLDPNQTVDFWKVPARLASGAVDIMDAPGPVTDDGYI